MIKMAQKLNMRYKDGNFKLKCANGCVFNAISLSDLQISVQLHAVSSLEANLAV